MDSSELTLIAINPVRAERADDFEQWLRTIAVPAVEQHRPDQAGHWRVLRAPEVADGVVTFAFLFEGGTAQDWELGPLLEQALGVTGAAVALGQLDDMLSADQVSWSFAPVRLDVTTD